MAANLSIKNGRVEMVSGSNVVPWHGLGTIVKGLMTAAEALNLAHLDWQIKGEPVSVRGKELPFPSPDRKSSEDCWQSIVRQDTGDTLGIMRGRYTPIQNAEAFSFFDRIVGEGKAVYDTAGALRGGRQIWLLAKVDGEIKINNDDHSTYALMVSSHDGSYSLMCSFVMVRVVCSNTLSMALAGAKNLVKIRHTENWQNAEDEARRILGIGQKYFDTVQEALGELGQHLLTPDQMEDFTKLLIPVSDEQKIPTRTANIRAEINRLFEKGPGNQGRTFYDAFNAVTDYADHYQTLRGENSTRIESAILGSGAQLKEKAFQYLSSEEIMSELLSKPHRVADNSAAAAGELARLLNQ